MNTNTNEQSHLRWTSGELAQITSGTLVGVGSVVTVTGISTDSRGLRPGDAFLAIKGERHDGADFAQAALSAGAALVIAEDACADGPTLVVSSTIDAYAAIARHHLARLRSRTGLMVVGITGSSGKTSTKDLLVSVLSPQMSVTWPHGSFNNDIGLPATVLTANDESQVLILEMGMRGLGHIARLCSIAPPDISVVLNVGMAHIGEVGSIEGIAAAKSEIVRHSAPGAIAVLNADDSQVCEMVKLAPDGVILFGSNVGEQPQSTLVDVPADVSASVTALDVTMDEHARASFTLVVTDLANGFDSSDNAPVTLPLAGAHQVTNALAAAAVAHALGMSVPAIAAGLATARTGSGWRMDVVHTATGVTIVNDAYNANPQSMAAGLRAAAAMKREGRLLAVLGDMLELGDQGFKQHQIVGSLCAELGVAWLGFVGDFGAAVRSGCPAAQIAMTWQEAASAVVVQAQPGDVIFIKASRGVGLERVADELVAAFGRVDS